MAVNPLLFPGLSGVPSARSLLYLKVITREKEDMKGSLLLRHFMVLMAIALNPMPLSLARAQTLDGVPVPDMPWKNDQGIVEEGVYEKASENISLQAIYVVKKLRKLQSLINAGQKDEARNDIATFCMNNPTRESTDD